jgi:hypothetical protein
MTTAISGYSTGAMAYVGSAYTGTASSSGSASSSNTAAQSASASDSVTLSDEALALYAAQSTDKDFSTVTADARTTLDALYKAANVTVPLAGGKPTIDLTNLDRRTIFAIASNSGNKFTPDEQTAASQEMLRRFEGAMGPPANAAKLIGDYSTLYKAALTYFDGMSAEEKATDDWKNQYAALTQGYQLTQQDPSKPPQGIANDPIAAILANPSGTGATKDFGSVAQGARLALDQQIDAANKKGVELVFDPKRRGGQLVDFSNFDNRDLSSISLNQGSLFSADEARAAKKELDARTRSAMLQAFQQGSKSGDLRAFSLGIIQQYQGMSAEERTAANWSSSFLETAVKNYQSSSSLMNMMAQMSGGSSSSLLGL